MEPKKGSQVAVVTDNLKPLPCLTSIIPDIPGSLESLSAKAFSDFEASFSRVLKPYQ